MKILQKIFMIVMVGMVAGNADVRGIVGGGAPAVAPPLAAPIVALPPPAAGAPRLDFDTIAIGQNVPGDLQPEWYNIPVVGINAPNVRYFYFRIVPAPGGAPIGGPALFNQVQINAHVGGRAARAPIVGETNIYFPEDGHQPTTPEAVAWSCANVDVGNPNSLITNWYMQMFGVIHFQGNGTNPNDYIKAGFARSTNQPIRIISFNLTVFDSNVSRYMLDMEKRGTINAFRRILSTPPGRLWAYRMLIEIRRGGTVNGDIGLDITDPNHRLYATNLQIRNSCRCVNVLRGDDDVFWCKNDNGCEIHLSFSNASVQIVSDLVRSGRYGKFRAIALHQDNDLSIDLFHELIHWFHYLRHTKRTWLEIVHNAPTSLSEKITQADYPSITIGRYYYCGVPSNSILRTTTNDRKRNSAKVWTLDTIMPCYEEMRTILGVALNTNGYMPGDELSENIYRLYLSNVPMRFGHTAAAYLEDECIVEKARNVSELYSKDISGNKKEYIYPHQVQIPNTINYGLGACKVW